MNAEVHENIFAELASAYENLKAEVLIAEIIENSDANSDDFVVANKSTFSRSHRRDIIDIDEIINDNKFTLNLSRNGIYDTLPEGLFHKQKGTLGDSSYAAHRKTAKQEEQDARLFFSPLENEFFYQKLRIERNERELLDDFYNLKDDFLINFWNIDSTIPQDYIIKLIKLLSHSYKIVGDFELTRLCLEKILNEKVTFKKKYKNNTAPEDISKNGTTKQGLQLGVDTLHNDNTLEIYSPKLEVVIGPMPKNKITNFLKDGGVQKFFNTFYDYFIPMEFDVTTKFTVIAEEGFSLNNEDSALMGISTQI